MRFCEDYLCESKQNTAPHALTTVLNIGDSNAERVRPAGWIELCVKHLALHRSKPCNCRNFEGAIAWHLSTLGAWISGGRSTFPQQLGLSKESTPTFLRRLTVSEGSTISKRRKSESI